MDENQTYLENFSTDDKLRIMAFITKKIRPFITDPKLISIYEDLENSISSKRKSFLAYKENGLYTLHVRSNLNGVNADIAWLLWNMTIEANLLIEEYHLLVQKNNGNLQRFCVVLNRASDIFRTSSKQLIDDFLSSIMEQEIYPNLS